MASGWQTNDVQTQERRNREWIARYLLGLPFPDRDDAGVAQVTPRAVGFAMTSAQAAVVTFPPAPLVIVHKFTLTNTGDLERLAWIGWHTGGALLNPTDITAISKSLQPRETIAFEGPWFCPGSTTVEAWSAAGAAGQVAGRIDYTVCLASTPGLTPIFGRVNLTPTPAALYTAPADVSSVFVASIGIMAVMGTDYANTVIVELLPAGQASAPQFYIANAPLAGWETEIMGGYTLQPGDAIRAWRIGPDAAVAHVNVIEFRG